jgi:hypothetical protein
VIQLAIEDLGDAAAILAAVERELPGLLTTTGQGDTFVFYDPDRVTVPEQRFPFLTVVTGDRYDAASNLDRDERAYRVNLGLDRPTYEQLLGPAPRQAAGSEVIDAGVDYAAEDVVLPHPFYAPMHWVCIVNPAEQTRSRLADMLEAAHELARRQYDNRRRRQPIGRSANLGGQERRPTRHSHHSPKNGSTSGT